MEQFGGPGAPEGYVYERGGESFLTTALDYPEQGGPYDFLAVTLDPACLSWVALRSRPYRWSSRECRFTRFTGRQDSLGSEGRSGIALRPGRQVRVRSASTRS